MKEKDKPLAFKSEPRKKNIPLAPRPDALQQALKKEQNPEADAVTATGSIPPNFETQEFGFGVHEELRPDDRLD